MMLAPTICDCPKCGRRLAAAGQAAVDSRPVPFAIFQCAECLDTFDFGGERFEAALTFAVDGAGAFRDADTLEPLDPARLGI